MLLQNLKNVHLIVQHTLDSAMFMQHIITLPVKMFWEIEEAVISIW